MGILIFGDTWSAGSLTRDLTGASLRRLLIESALPSDLITLMEIVNIMKSKLDEFGALIHASWREGKKPDEIEGYWAEDMHPFTITVPPPLRDELIALQRALCKKYNAIEKARADLLRMERDAVSFVGEHKDG